MDPPSEAVSNLIPPQSKQEDIQPKQEDMDAKPNMTQLNKYESEDKCDRDIQKQEHKSSQVSEPDTVITEIQTIADWRDDDFLSFSSKPKTSTHENTEDTSKASSHEALTCIQAASPSKKKHHQATHNSIHQTCAPWNLLDSSTMKMNNGISFTKSGTSGETFYLHNGIYRKVSPLITLHNEIIHFVTLMSPLPEEIQYRQSLIQRIQSFIINLFTVGEDKEKRKIPSCTISIFGSQATGLILPSSDIDMVVCFNTNTPSTATGNDSSNPIILDGNEDDERKQDSSTSSTSNNKPLIQMFEAFRDSEEWKDEFSYFELILESRIPILKFTHGPTNISVDISIDQPLGPQTATLCLQYMDALPALRPLTIVLKYFLHARGLNEPFSGGMGSYALFLMIVSFLQHREREERERHRMNHISARKNGTSSSSNNNNHNTNVGGMNLGALLMDFLELYGMDFNYVTTAMSIRYDGRYFPKGAKDRKETFWCTGKLLSCGLENPLDSTMDVGKSTFRMHVIQRSFETAFRVLLARISEPLPLIPGQKKNEEDVVLDRGDGSILSSIIPPTEAMNQRAIKVKEVYRSMSGSSVQQNVYTQGYARYDQNETKPKSTSTQKSSIRSNSSDMSVSSNEVKSRERSRYDNGRNYYGKRQRDESKDRDYNSRHWDSQGRYRY